MPLEPGTRLGPYAVTAKIGEGGMGQVYRARDTKLDRNVVLKVFPPAFIEDPDRLARFERDAKVPAALGQMSSWNGAPRWLSRATTTQRRWLGPGALGECSRGHYRSADVAYDEPRNAGDRV